MRQENIQNRDKSPNAKSIGVNIKLIYKKFSNDPDLRNYINEMIFKLTTWDDRTTQAVAGTGDWSNMENPGNFVEARPWATLLE